jgi:hypothetical protein
VAKSSRVSSRKRSLRVNLTILCRSGGMADAADSKSADRKVVKVRLLSPAPESVGPALPFSHCLLKIRPSTGKKVFPSH